MVNDIKNLFCKIEMRRKTIVLVLKDTPEVKDDYHEALQHQWQLFAHPGGNWRHLQRSWKSWKSWNQQ